MSEPSNIEERVERLEGLTLALAITLNSTIMLAPSSSKSTLLTILQGLRTNATKEYSGELLLSYLGVLEQLIRSLIEVD